MQDADTWFASLIGAIDVGDNPIPISEFNADVEGARDKAIRFYRELLKDFEVNMKIADLQGRMKGHFVTKVTHYHDRIRRWVMESLANDKDTYLKTLQSMEVPIDPDELKKKSDSVAASTTRSLTSALGTFAKPG